jgi:hypothetical protein
MWYTKLEKRGYAMAASNDLAALADRAKQAEDRVAAAKKQARSDLEKQTAKARDGAQRKAEQLKAQTATAAANASQWWNDVQSTWSEHVAHVREDIDNRKAERDAKKAQRHADAAEDDAVAAVAFAEAALEEAEYAVLTAALARLDADALSK